MATLAFKTEWPKEWPVNLQGRTMFAEKILTAMGIGVESGFGDHDDISKVSIGVVRPKIHTIRKPSKNWDKGKDAHLAINVRTKRHYQFAPTIKIPSVQTLELKRTEYRPEGFIYSAKVDETELGELRVLGGIVMAVDTKFAEFIRNDGFDNAAQFARWFSEGGNYSVIHFTDFKY